MPRTPHQLTGGWALLQVGGPRTWGGEVGEASNSPGVGGQALGGEGGGDLPGLAMGSLGGCVSFSPLTHSLLRLIAFSIVYASKCALKKKPSRIGEVNGRTCHNGRICQRLRGRC